MKYEELTGKEAREFLINEKGFNSYDSESSKKLNGCTWSTYRRTTFENAKECLCNDRVPQIGVYYYNMNLPDGSYAESYKIEIVNENDLGWFNLDYYGLSFEQLKNDFDKYEASLIRAWEAAWNEN